MLARMVTSLAALSGGRIVLGMGAGGLWDRISDMGVARLSPGDAVDAFEEAIVLVRLLSGGGPPVTHQGRHYRVEQIEPAPVAAPPVWTGSVGQIPGRHRPGGRRLDPRPRRGLAQRAIPGVAARHRRRGGRRGP